MITGHETETYGLTPDEKRLVKPITLYFNALPRGVYVKSSEIEKYFKVNGARLRKLINFIRERRLVKYLLSNSKGYYVTDDKEEVMQFIQSMKERADAILHIALVTQASIGLTSKITKKKVEHGNEPKLFD